jgi:hypothetical protein
MDAVANAFHLFIGPAERYTITGAQKKKPTAESCALQVRKKRPHLSADALVPPAGGVGWWVGPDQFIASSRCPMFGHDQMFLF